MTTRRGLLAVALACALAAPSGCADQLPAAGWPPRTLLARARPLRVGVARAQITPPPGVSLFGHGPSSRVAAGVWTRLYCRAFVFEAQEAGTPELFALVSCDLPAISTLLQRAAVARARRAGLPLSAPRLLLAATHTHAGPAHYFGAANYNGMMSTRLPGFDGEVLDFLAARVATALRRAHARLAPARLAWAHEQVWGFSRNRSLVPFTLNQPPYEPRPAGLWAQLYARLPEDRRAIDPAVDTLWIYHAQRRRLLGALTFLALHPTMIGPGNQLFNADIFGVLSRRLDAEMIDFNAEMDRLDGPPGDDGPPGEAGPPGEPLHAVINTNSGDIAPLWSSGSLDEVQTRGRLLARLIWGQRRPQPPPPGPVEVGLRYTEVYLPGARLGPGRRLCPEAGLGVAAPKGAADHSTIFHYSDQFNDARLVRRCYHACQEPKRALFGALQGLCLVDEHSFPRWAPLALLQLGGTLIAAVPAELTATAGHRVREALARRAALRGLPVDHALIAGLTNGYLQYVTTRDEYMAQFYEGASTLYGPETLELLGLRLEQLVDDLAGGVTTTVERAGAHPYAVGTRRRRMPRGGCQPEVAAPGPARGPVSLCRLPGELAPALCFVWRDGAPARVWWSSGCSGADLVPRARWLELAGGPAVAADAGCADLPRLDDDRGTRFTTRAHERSGPAWIWSSSYRFDRTRWDALQAPGARICVRAGARAGDVASRVVEPAALPLCEPREALFCAGLIPFGARRPAEP